MCEKYNIPLTKESKNFLLYTTTNSFLQKNMPDMTVEQRLEFGKEIKQREIAAVRERSRLFDGVMEVLATLANDGNEMVICGMGSKEYIEAVLDHCGISGYFKAVYHRVDGLTKA
jgi:phosphoglycolate phosphatase-like HAD superfamily hydrolase